MILYFGCNNVDYSGRKQPSYQKTWTVKKATQYYIMGKAIAQLIQNTEQTTRKAHIRRAHDHHYWTGKRDGKQEQVRRFVHPVFVNCHNAKEVSIKTRLIHIKKESE